MSYRYFEVGYKVVKIGKHAVSCAMGNLGAVGLRPFLSKSPFAATAMTLAISAALALAPSVGRTEAIVIDGSGSGGFLIDSSIGNTGAPLQIGDGEDASLDRYEGGSKTITTLTGETTVFTAFDTRGGNGSGGGAGLGGVFFVDQGALLKLNDVVFAGNSVRGGDGGSDPALRFGNKSLALQPNSLDLLELDQQLATPYVFKSGQQYKFQDIDLSSTGADLISLGAPITFDTLDTPATAVVSKVTGGSYVVVNPDNQNDTLTVTGDTVTLAAPITLGANDVTTLSDGYTVSGNEIDLTNATSAQIDSIQDSVETGSVVFIGDFSSRVTGISFDEDTGDISKITLEDDASASEGSGEALDVISLNSFKLKQFSVDNSEVSVKSEQRGFEVGMSLFDPDGNPLGTEITSVSPDGSSFTVDDPAALENVGSFEARKSPLLSSTEIEVSSGLISDFYPGATVYFTDTQETATVSEVRNPAADENYAGAPTLVLSDEIASLSALESRIADGDEIGIELRNVKEAAGTSITVRAAGLTLEKDMILQGAGIAEGTTIDSVGSVDNEGFVTIGLSNEINGDVTSIVAKSALSKGGAMNSLSAGSSGSNGDNGFDMNGFSSFFNSGEGQEGTRGYAGSDGDGGAGGDGGYGGNGSDGMPVNPDALRTLKSTTSAFISATGELAAAVSPDPVVGAAVSLPDPLEIATKTFKFSGKSLDFATAVFENVQWGINLSRGIAGMGGAGGEGGEGGGGDEFFGGGAGGAGGAGGEGALSFTDGGNGGDGGRGGNGGFGAGGGSGGPGGDEGSTGAADGGNPGDGGTAGFAAGDGSRGDGLFGGGGSGFGGAIFVRDTGELVINGNAHFLNNVARGGSSNNEGSAGDGAGAALFMMKGSTVTLAPGEGEVITFDDDIADNSSATYEGAPFSEGDGADLIIHGDGGLVLFNVENSYTGNTILRGSTLDAELGVGLHDASRLVFDGGGTVGNGTLSQDTSGALLLQDDFTGRRAGLDDFQVQWSGSGGFASGVVESVRVNLGESVQGLGLGQTLTWGRNGFFDTASGAKDPDVIKNENAPTATLTFGSNQSVGSVEFANDVLVPQGEVARVAVYNTGTGSASSTAILSGNWSGSELVIGDTTTDYTGALYMTGQNAMERVQVLGGAVSTFNPADPSTSGKLFAAAADIRVGEGSALELYGTEDVNVVTVEPASTVGEPAGALRLYGAMSAATVSNSGLMQVEAGTDIARTSDGNGDMLTTAGSLDVSGTLANVSSARVMQNGDISVGTEVINDGDWSITGSSELEITNAALGVTDAGLTGIGTFCLETVGGDAAVCAGTDEAPDMAATTLTLNQAGDSTFDGVFAGLGALEKTGAGTLTLTNAQSFLGGMTVSDGVIATGTNATPEPETLGTFADALAVTVNTGGQLDVNNADTFGSLTNSGLVNVNADQTVAFIDNASDGLINLSADLTATDEGSTLTATGDFKNGGLVEVLGGNRTLKVVTLTGAGIIDGDENGTAHTLTVNQSGTSTYAGSVTGVDDFVKTGAGTLTLAGANAYTGTGLVQEGSLIIGTPAAMGVGNDYIVSDQATLRLNSSTGRVTGDEVTVNDRGILDVDSEFKATLLSNSGLSMLDAELEISTHLENTSTGRVDANADVTARNVDNDGPWNVLSSRTLNVTGTEREAAGLTGGGEFCLETAGAELDVCNGLAPAADAEVAPTTLTLNQAGDSTFDGVFAGLGSLEKTGAGTLTLTNAQSFLGGMTVSDGVIATGTNATPEPETLGTFADALAVTVNTGGQLDVNNADTFGSLTNSGIVNVNADQTVVLAQTRGGTLNLNANVTTTGAFTVDDEGTNTGIVNVNGAYTITADGGLAGNGDITVADGHNLTLSQETGTISTFRGTITSDQAPTTSRLTLDGGGELILAGSEGEVSLGVLNIVDGRVVLDRSELLADTITVDVADRGILELRDADDGSTRQESIERLEGAGEIYLGRNTLNVVNGGTFEGEFFGTGSVNVENGSFTINNSLTSDDGSLMVSNAGGTTVSQGTTLSVNSVQVMDGARMNVAGNGIGATEISRVTTSDMTVETNSTLHMGTGSYSQDAETFSVIEADSILINGQFAGNGTLVAPVINASAAAAAPRARITPGDSPGVQMFMGDQTTFGSNSTLEIEVADRTLGAGVGFDQVRFMTGGRVILKGDARLSVVDLAEQTFNADNYDLGELVKFADFDPLAITGQFGSVEHAALDTNPNDLVVNLATGTLVGIGTRDLGDAATNSNQQAMLDGFKVSSAGGVDQFYGGRFVENLTASWDAGEDLSEVFNKASPEVYAGLSGSAETAAASNVRSWFRGYVGEEGQNGSFFDVSRSHLSSKDSGHEFQGFGVQSTNSNVGFNISSSELSFLFTLGTASTDLSSDYVDGSGDGLVVGFSVGGELLDTPNTIWTAGVQHANLSIDGSRVANNGLVNFSDVTAEATQFHLGLEHHRDVGDTKLGVRANLEFGSSKSDAFSETTAATNVLDTMAVESVSNDYTRLNMGLQAAHQMMSGTQLVGGFDILMPIGSSKPSVGASYDQGQGAFEVMSSGLDEISFAPSIGVNADLSDFGVVSARIGAQNTWNGDAGFTASLSTQFQF